MPRDACQAMEMIRTKYRIFRFSLVQAYPSIDVLFSKTYDLVSKLNNIGSKHNDLISYKLFLDFTVT